MPSREMWPFFHAAGLATHTQPALPFIRMYVCHRRAMTQHQAGRNLCLTDTAAAIDDLPVFRTVCAHITWAFTSNSKAKRPVPALCPAIVLAGASQTFR